MLFPFLRTKMKKNWLKYIIALLAFAGIAGGSISYYRSKQYEIIHPTRGEITEAVYGLGKVKSNNRFEVIVGVISTVTHRFVEEGQFVLKGAPLIQFESSALFRAPFDGTITFAPLYQGETALPHVPTLRIEDLSNRYIELSLEQQAILRVRPGLPAKVSFESIRGKVLNGKVTAIFPREDEFLTHISVTGLDESVLPGMTADVTIEIGKIPDAILVPLKAVKNSMVIVNKNGRWQKIKVEVGHIDGLFAEIKGGTLSPQDDIRVKAEN